MTVREYNICVDNFADAVYRFIRSDLRDDERAHDIVQDSFEKLWKQVAEIEYGVAKAWLFSTAYREMIDIIRKERKLTLTDSYNDSDLSDDYGVYSDINEILHKALEKLPEQHRTALLLRDYEGYSYKEIGDITGTSEAQVKINIYRGRLAMREYLVSMENVV
jgi:RNA polymerase sigma-70 factor (ECF subfamily)